MYCICCKTGCFNSNQADRSDQSLDHVIREQIQANSHIGANIVRARLFARGIKVKAIPYIVP